MAVLKYLLSDLLDNAFVATREEAPAVDNAEVHKAQNYIFNIDLKDFFPFTY